MRIVIVEDEATARHALVQVINNLRNGHTVVAQAGDGKKGFELIMKLKPDLVFTDVKMNPVNGIEMISMLRKEKNVVRVVIISAYEEFDYAKAALELNVLDYITKPIVQEEIEHCVLKAERLLHPPEVAEAPAPEPSAGAEGFLHPCVKKAISIIERDYSLAINQNELAHRLRITPQYFSYLFKRDTGYSFTLYLRRYRVRIAKEMLQDNAVKVAEVASCIGYPDSKYFCRVFKTETGMSPTQYLFQYTTGDK